MYKHSKVSYNHSSYGLKIVYKLFNGTRLNLYLKPKNTKYSSSTMARRLIEYIYEKEKIKFESIYGLESKDLFMHKLKNTFLICASPNISFQVCSIFLIKRKRNLMN